MNSASYLLVYENLTLLFLYIYVYNKNVVDAVNIWRISSSLKELLPIVYFEIILINFNLDVIKAKSVDHGHLFFAVVGKRQPL